jgi:hypothetical protein
MVLREIKEELEGEILCSAVPRTLNKCTGNLNFRTV